MAAEKLTKARLAQILIMMAILIGAFTWRSVTHSKIEYFCEIDSPCNFDFSDLSIEILPNIKDQALVLSTKPYDKNLQLSSLDKQVQIKVQGDKWMLSVKQIPTVIRIETTTNKKEVSALIRLK